MAEFLLDPQGFQGQIDSFKAGADTIKEISYALDKQGVRLQTIDKYMECVEEFNKTVALFVEMMNQDTESMKQIKAKWMNLDSDIGKKTLGEILSNALFGSE